MAIHKTPLRILLILLALVALSWDYSCSGSALVSSG
jgi:hypothetical protein